MSSPVCSSSSSEVGDELVTCTICLERFTNPKTLLCLHTFCESCLRRHLAACMNQRADLMHPAAIPCPTCRELTPLPEDGVSGLRTDFKISKIIDFLQQVSSKIKVCDICKTVRRDSPAAHYCRDCNKHLCIECIYRHKNTEVFEGHVVKELMSDKNSRAVCKEHEDEMESLRYYCQSCEISICTLCAMTEHMLHNLTDIDTGRARSERTKKIQVLTSKIGANVKQINNFLSKLNAFEEKLTSSYEVTSKQIQARADEIVADVLKQKEQLLSSLQDQYQGKMDNICSERHNLLQCKENFVTLKNSAEKATGEEEPGPFFEASSDLIRDLKTASQVQFLNPDDFSAVDARFDLKFPEDTPSLGVLGETNLSGNLRFMSRIPIQLVSKITNGHLEWPSDVDIMANRELIVADTENYQLKVFDTKGVLKRCIAVGEVKPAGLVVTKVNTIVVTDILDRCAKIFSEHGQLLFAFGHAFFDSPAGIAVNGLGEYIITDIGNHCVTKHDSQGNILARVGSFGHSDTMFDCPWYVTTNDINDVIVSDMGNHCIKIFDEKLQFLSKIEDPVTLMCPNGISVDLQGHLLVCDSGRNTVSMYTADGHFIDDILTSDDGIDNPHGLVVNESGMLALTQCDKQFHGKHEIRLYQLYD